MKIRQVLDRLDEISRRDFLKGAGAAAVGGLAGKDSKADWSVFYSKDKLTNETIPWMYHNRSKEDPLTFLSMSFEAGFIFLFHKIDIVKMFGEDTLRGFKWTSGDDRIPFRGIWTPMLANRLYSQNIGRFRILVGDFSSTNRPMNFVGFGNIEPLKHKTSNLLMADNANPLNTNLFKIIYLAYVHKKDIKIEYLGQVFTFSGKKEEDIGPLNK